MPPPRGLPKDKGVRTAVTPRGGGKKLHEYPSHVPGVRRFCVFPVLLEFSN